MRGLRGASILLGLATGFAATPRLAAEELRLDGRAQGTTYRIRASERDDGGGPTEDALAAQVEAELRRVDSLFSAWRPDSEIERFNRGPAGTPFTLSPETVSLLARARELWQLTGGAFDPTLGRAIALWGFGAGPRRIDVPAESEIVAALRACGFDKTTLRDRTLVKTEPDLRIDLSGIAQGYSVDRLFERVREAGYRRVLVEIGGEVRVAASGSPSAPWRVGIDDPGGHGLHATLELVEGSVSTSGDYRSGFEVDGKRYSHVLDPRDGWPVRTGVVSSTVVAADAATADALATALMVLGPEKAVALADGLPDVDCLLLVRQEDGGLREVRSAGIGRWLR